MKQLEYDKVIGSSNILGRQSKVLMTAMEFIAKFM